MVSREEENLFLPPKRAVRNIELRISVGEGVAKRRRQAITPLGALDKRPLPLKFEKSFGRKLA